MLQTATLCTKGRGSERAVAVVHDGELGEERREREWPHGHELVVDHLGSGGAPRTMQGGSSPAAAIPPSWRCTGGGGVDGRCWGGVVWGNCSSGRAAFIGEYRRVVDGVQGS